MKVVIAPDSFKGSMSALVAAQAIAAGVRDVCPDSEIVIVPLADGGEGTVEALVTAVPGSVTVTVDVRGPLGETCRAGYGLLGESRDTAVVEMAAASGLTLLPADRRNPMSASTFGTGELLSSALSHGVRRLIVGLGGSATNDCGVGCLAALGVKFLTASGRQIGERLSSKNLPLVASADSAQAYYTDAEIVIACDVTNPLLGPNGATAVFGPQKGVSPALVPVLEECLAGFAPVLDQIACQRMGTLNRGDETYLPISERPSAGAAGGLAAGLMALFPSAKVRPGIDLMLDVTGFDQLIESADLVITGEGRLDAQTLAGKTVAGILRRTSKRGIPTIALAGSIDPAAAVAMSTHGLESAHALMELVDSVDEAIAGGAPLLRELARRHCGPR